jgi:hypothetical protein
MAATTALTLVNRLLARLKYDPVSTFTPEHAVLALELVNTATRTLLAERDYPWNIRSDGMLSLIAPIEATSGWNFTSASTALIGSWTGTANDYTGGTNAGTVVTRVLLTSGPATHTDTAMIVQSVSDVGSLLVTLSADHPGFTTTSTDYAYKFFFSEYLLPNTVAKVLSVRNQNYPLRLFEVEPHSSWDEWIPRPHDTEDDDPIIVGVGGSSVSTYNAGLTSTPNQRLRLMVWPVPSAVNLLNYSYKERHTQLVDVDDVFHSPIEFTDDIIDLAEAKAYGGAWQNDPQLAALLTANANAMTRRKYANSRLDPGRRHRILSHDSGKGRRSDPTKYRDISGL